MPLYPFLLWSTNDWKTGDLYLKIDRKTIRVASTDLSPTAEDPVLKAMGLFIKAAHVFNLEYHPYLRHVFNYLEFLMCINDDPVPTVSTFAAAIREQANSL